MHVNKPKVNSSDLFCDVNSFTIFLYNFLYTIFFYPYVTNISIFSYFILTKLDYFLQVKVTAQIFTMKNEIKNFWSLAAARSIRANWPLIHALRPWQKVRSFL